MNAPATTEPSALAIRSLNADEVDAVSGGKYPGQPTFYEMGGHIYVVYHDKHGKATGTVDLGETSTS